MRQKAFFLLVAALFLLLTVSHLRAFEVGGGGSEQYPPATVQAGQPAIVKYIVSVWGQGGSIAGRYRDITLHYRLLGEADYRDVAARPAPLPENYRKATTERNQWEAYEFVIPPTPAGQGGTIEFFITSKLDGHANKQAGLKAISVVP
ncbi:MAG: hypothetical protein KBA75_06970 [Alphaproteobacteria bacterium]|nr:hypothetical protein [Alphaproteobacteria bacterium]